MFKVSLLAGACLSVVVLPSVHAQATPSAADVLRGIEQNKSELFRASTKATTSSATTHAPNQGDIAKLHNVQIHTPMFAHELAEYWRDLLGQSISVEKQNEFNAFAWNLFQKNGYLPYISIHPTHSNNGSTLHIHVSFPKVGKLTVVTADGDKGQEFISEVTQRFNAVYKTGMAVDIQGLENQLSAVAYDLPVDLEVSLRQVSDAQMDVVIYLRPIEHQIGKVLGGFVQGNNYGLSQFGRTQILGNVRITGFTPQAEVTLTTQQSQGVAYYRADYEVPWKGTGARLRFYTGTVNSHADNSKGASQEAGIGITQLLSTDRIGRWLAGSELSRRKTQNWASDVLASDRVDDQLRFKLRAESSNGWVDHFNNEIVLSVGSLNLDRVEADKAADINALTGLNISGTYKKFEMNGGLSHSFDEQRVYTGSVRWKAQAASNNLDGYNRFSLGGINGVRAYSNIEAVGDQGALLSFDITHQVKSDVWGGLFYDVGMVKNNHSPLPNATDTSHYTLRSAGWQIGGKISGVNWNLSTAFALGKTPGAGVWSPTFTQTGDFRTNFSVTYAF